MITLTYSKLITVDQDGTQLDLTEQIGSEILSGGINAVGDKKTMYCDFQVEDNDVDAEQLTLPGAKLWVNWALFFPTGGVYSPIINPPTVGFSIVIPQTSYEADRIEMPFHCPETHFPKSLKNLRCYFTFLTENTFRLELEYYNGFDENGYMNNEPKSNQWRFLAESWNNFNFNEIEGSVYDTSKDLRLYLYIEQDDAPIPETFEGPIIESYEYVLWQGQIQRFNAQTEFTDSDGEEIQFLQSEIDTHIVARLYADEDTLDEIYVKIIRIRDDLTMDLEENYEIREAEMIAGAEPSGVFVGPFSISWNPYGPYYEMEFDVNHEELTPGAQYRLMIVGYSTTGSLSGIGPALTTTALVPYCQTNCATSEEDPILLDFSASLFDIDNEYTGNFLTCAIEERMRTKLVVDYSDNRWKNNIDCRRGMMGGESAASNDIRNYLKVITLQIYTEYTDATLGGTVRNVLDEKVIQRTAQNTYIGSGINVSFDLINETLTLYYDFRNRNQSTIPALYSTLNGVGYSPVQDDQYWGGKTIFITWGLGFFYHDWPVPFQDSLYVTQKMVVRDYSGDITFQRITYGNYLCPGQQVCYNALLGLANPETYNVINTVEISDGNGGGNGNPDEQESWTPGELSQMTSSKFIGQDIDFTDGDGQFCTVINTLLPGFTYKFAAMAKKQ